MNHKCFFSREKCLILFKTATLKRPAQTAMLFKVNNISLTFWYKKQSCENNYSYHQNAGIFII